MDSKLDLRRLSGLAMAIGLATYGTTAGATVQLDPQAIDMNTYRIVPTLAVQESRDDNIYSLNSSAVSSDITTIAPTVALIAQDRDNTYTAQYGIKAGFYSQSRSNYVDQALSGSGHIELNSRFRFDAGAGYSAQHDDLGTGYTTGFSLDHIRQHGGPDAYKLANIHLYTDYGAQDAAGHILFNTDVNQKRYDSSLVAGVRDYNDLFNLLGFHLRVAPKTNVLLDYERDDTSFTGNTRTPNIDGATTPPDNTDNRYLVGVSWESSAATTGKLRLGADHRSVQNSPSVSGFTWDAGVVWSPLKYSTFTFDGGQREVNGNAPIVTVRAQTITLGWNHDWSDRVSSRLSYGNEHDDNFGQANGTGPDNVNVRTDKITTIGASLNYQMRRWLVLGAGYSDMDHHSTVDAFSFTRHIFSLNAQISL